MATTMLTIQIESNQSSSNLVSAHQLGSKERLELGLNALTGKESISEQSRRYDVSRKFIYQQQEKAEEALEKAFDSPVKEDKVLFYIPVTKAWIQQVVLGLIFLCHSSFRGVVEFLGDLLDIRISIGTIHNLVEKTVPKAQQINQSYDLSSIQVGSPDELFQAGKPVLAAVDLDSTYCYLLAAEDHRDADTWAIHLMDLEKQGLSPEYTVADGGLGLRAGQAIVWPETPCFGDTFHILQEMSKVSRRLEKRAEKAITRLTEMEKKWKKPNERIKEIHCLKN